MSIPWLTVERHAKGRIEKLRGLLETAQAQEIAELQAEVRAWRGVLNLPHDLAGERLEPDKAGYA